MGTAGLVMPCSRIRAGPNAYYAFGGAWYMADTAQGSARSRFKTKTYGV